MRCVERGTLQNFCYVRIHEIGFWWTVALPYTPHTHYDKQGSAIVVTTYVSLSLRGKPQNHS